MEMITGSIGTVSLGIEESSQVGEARRLAATLAREHSFPATEVSTASLLATEAANNLVKHAGGGELVFQIVEDGGIKALEILSLDKGPGMADVERCLKDGYSTAGSPGTGLGAMARLSTVFDIYSRPQQGTVVLMRLAASSSAPSEPKKNRFLIGGVSVPMPSEPVCGDGWLAVERPGRLTMMVSDGLGHGQLAADASREAVRVLRENAERTPVELIERAHAALRSTRGAAVAVAEINLEDETVRFAGIGNIAGTILSGGATRSTVSHNGIVGHQMHKVQEMNYPWPPDGLLVMHSDGIQTRWSLDGFPGLERCHPTLVAAVMYRDFKRPRDDVTVSVARLVSR